MQGFALLNVGLEKGFLKGGLSSDPNKKKEGW
jgi:hypothetical protein